MADTPAPPWRTDGVTTTATPSPLTPHRSEYDVMTGTCRAANALLGSAMVGLAAAGGMALVDGAVSALAFALLAAAGILAVLGLAVNVRQVASRSVRTVTVAVAKAPRESYWRGYGDASADALAPNTGDTQDLAAIR